MIKFSVLLTVTVLFLKCGDVQEEITVDEDGRTALHIAVLEGDAEKAVESAADTSLVNYRDRYGYTPLHYACKTGSIKLVDLLLLNGSGINIRNKYGETPLHWAALKGHSDIINLLLEKGAEPLIMDKGGKTPAEAALDESNIEAANLLFPLHKAIRDGDPDRIREFLNKYPGLLNSRDGFGFTPLHIAYKYDNNEAIELLRANGADKRAKDNFGYEPVYYSAKARAERKGICIIDQEVEENIDNLIYMELQKYDNINIGLVIDGETVLTKNYGVSGLNKAYPYGSVSKALTGMIVMQLLGEGVIESLDDNIWKYSDRYRDCMPDRYRGAGLTIKHLLTHTSGIPHNSEPAWKDGKLNLKFRPGEKDMYSTPAYGVIGHVIEDATGLTYDQLVRKYIGRPVGATSFWAQKHFRAPGARINSNIKDMALFAKGVMQNVYLQESVLYGQVIKKHSRLTGISWQIAETDGEDVKIFHGGSNGRPQAYLVIKPVKKLAVCILATSKDRNSFELDALGERLLSFIEGRTNN
ncbi:ankyrin repeat domain-containing protein [candidate division KSB1 bacterium]